jgi:hypothetical protein
LRTAGDEADIIANFLPLYLGKIDANHDFQLMFLQAPLADALSKAGRWDDLDKMYAAAERAWPLGSSANALNVSANHASFLLQDDRPGEALDLIDRSLADAGRRGDDVNVDAVVQMHGVRVCALHRLGRATEAGMSLAIASGSAEPSVLTNLQLCIGDAAAAKRTLISSLANDGMRTGALAALQEPVSGPCQSAYCRRQWDGWQKLRVDPDVLDQVARYGRILPYSIGEGAGIATASGH